jgi:hypothetical protein
MAVTSRRMSLAEDVVTMREQCRHRDMCSRNVLGNFNLQDRKGDGKVNVILASRK